jgi:L-alanine-DL-glutamate epimerase-like enolase superfamily enzyme
MMAACHAMATVPNFLVLEWHWGHPAERLARWKQYVQEGDIIQKGYITVSDRPGIGLTLNEEAMRKMVRPGSAWFSA